MSHVRIGNLVTCMLLVSGTHIVLGAQESPYIDLAARAIKALSVDEITALRNGAGMGYALAAELNHYPGPKHVLELKDSLALSSDQAEVVNEIYAEMLEAAQALGEELITAETHLDSLFQSGTISPESLDAAVTRAGHAELRLRVVHLGAHLTVRALLTEHQRQTYDRLRGYGAGRQHIHGNR